MEIDMAGVSVFLAMPTHRDIPANTVISLIATQRAMRDHNIPFHIHLEVGGSLVHHARTSLVHQFMQTDCTHLFWVDSDICWEAADFLKLIALATKMEVVCGSYPTKADPPVFFMQYAPGPHRTNEYGCVEIKGIGIGFSVIQRKVVEELYSKAPKRKYPWSKDLIPRVFRCDSEGIEERGEDMAFFSDVRDLGYKVQLDPTVKLGHIGPKIYEGTIAYLEKEEAA